MDASADVNTPNRVEQNSGDAQEERKTPELDLTDTTLEINDAVLKKVAERVEANSWPLVRPDDYEGDVAQQDVCAWWRNPWYARRFVVLYFVACVQRGWGANGDCRYSGAFL